MISDGVRTFFSHSSEHRELCVDRCSRLDQPRPQRSANTSVRLCSTNEDFGLVSKSSLQVCPPVAWNEFLRTLVYQLTLFRLPSPELAAFSNLKSLFLNQNRLVGLPDCLGALVKLECLSVSYNFLESLPDSIANLKSLREVKLASNRFHNFPEKLSELPNLELLDLSANVIETFNTKSASLSNLMVIHYVFLYSV